MHDEASAARYALAATQLHDPVQRARVIAAIAALDGAAAPRLAVVAGAPRLADARHVGILAGSFNPPTLAHEQLAERARASSDIAAIIWTISRVTVNKEAVTHAPLADRLLILEALIAPRPREAVALINRGLYVEQIAAIRASLPHVQAITFVIGFDKIVQIVDPHYYTDRDAALNLLFSQAEILVAPRDEHTEGDLTALFARPENQRWATRVHFLPLDPQLRDIASSHIRAHGAAPQSTLTAVPPEGQALIDSGAYADEKCGSSP